MSPLDPLRPGELRIRTPHSDYRKSSTNQPIYHAPRRHSGRIAGLLTCMLLVLAFKACSGSDNSYYSAGGGSGSDNSSYSAAAGSLPSSSSIPQLRAPISNPLVRAPILPGKYAAFIRREGRRSVDALVFTYATVQIITVGSESEALAHQYLVSNSEQIDPTSTERIVQQLGEWNSPETATSLPSGRKFGTLPPLTLKSPKLYGQSFALTQRPPPHMIRGDVIVDVGDLVNRNRLKANLIAKHGDLKAASIDIIEGTPRGPPDLLGPERQVVTVYVIGKVLKFNGPVQRGQSTLDASILDLGPTQQESDRYEADMTSWVHERFAKDVTLSLRSTDPYESGRYRPVCCETERRYEYHPPEYHPPAFEGIP